VKRDVIIVALSTLGIAVALTAYSERLSGVCPVGGCSAVFESGFSKLLGVPLEIWAVAWFSAVPALIIMNRLGVRWLKPVATVLIIIGVVAIPPLVYIELAIIQSVCMYCTAMHVLILAIALTWFLTSGK